MTLSSSFSIKNHAQYKQTINVINARSDQTIVRKPNIIQTNDKKTQFQLKKLFKFFEKRKLTIEQYNYKIINLL